MVNNLTFDDCADNDYNIVRRKDSFKNELNIRHLECVPSFIDV